MSQLVESIWIRNGRIHNMTFHQARYATTYFNLFGRLARTTLRRLIDARALAFDDVKCRILYDKSGAGVSYEKYERKPIETIRVLTDDQIEYPYKFLARPNLDALFQQRGDADEIAIVKNGLFTDAYYYNLVFENRDGLFTPRLPLLEGTMRQSLLEKKYIRPADIAIDQLGEYEKIHLINALNPLDFQVIPVSGLKL
ncbi:MAG: aminotransferase class IV [Saprospiraceae bacterium]|nr:aminotransferase class IV [Saprospiraceae bacterium]